jgi:hypothetical protein
MAQVRSGLTGETELRRGIGGSLLGTLTEAATVSPGKAQGGWVEVSLTGWIVRGSVGPSSQSGFDLVVSAQDGENLRAAPNGAVVARLQRGTLLRKIGSRAGWWHVRRAGWIQRRALAVPLETAALARHQAPTAPRQAPSPPRPSTPSQTVTQHSAAQPTPAEPMNGEARDVRVEVARSAPLAVAPEGGRAGTLEAGTDARVVGRAGDWVRVRFEGWMREADLKPSTDGALVGVSAAEVRAEPQRFVGQTVEWRVQLIAIQNADELRSELPAGQPFLLTRGPLPEPGFVYVILSRDQASQFQNLPPLQELVLRVTIKAPRTKYLATPVVELASIVSGVSGK